jgi:hypothetical protein
MRLRRAKTRERTPSGLALPASVQDPQFSLPDSPVFGFSCSRSESEPMATALKILLSVTAFIGLLLAFGSIAISVLSPEAAWSFPPWPLVMLMLVLFYWVVALKYIWAR